MTQPEKPEGFDYEALAANIAEMREVLNSVVAGLVADGFTDREARGIVSGMFANMNKSSGDDG